MLHASLSSRSAASPLSTSRTSPALHGSALHALLWFPDRIPYFEPRERESTKSNFLVRSAPWVKDRRIFAVRGQRRSLRRPQPGPHGPHAVPGMVAESGWPGRGELLAKKGPTVGGVGCPPNCRTSGKPRGSSDLFELFRKMLHLKFGKIPKMFG